jgi:signal transduction histidine kinase
VTVGIIAVFLKNFINQINNGLKAEIEEKTRELQNANKRLQELDAKKNEFISIASHELKGPIQPIFGFAELAQSGDIDQKEAWEGVTTLAKKLQELANDILDVTRIESNRLELHLQGVSVNEIIQETIKMQRTGLEKRITLGVSLGRDAIVHVDRTRIEQVLRNIISNAIKFTEKGSVTVSTRIEDDMLFTTVQDTGLGIPEEILPNIFGKFVTKSHGRENHSGNGLGLFLCKGIIDAHGGKITARNNKGGGATFEFSIPLVKKVKSIANCV